MRASLVIGVGLLLASVRATATEAVLLPSAPLLADGEHTQLLRLFLVDGDRLSPALPTVRAERGAVVGAPVPVEAGGVELRYRPPKVSSPVEDTLVVTVNGRKLRVPVALKPAGRTRLELEVTPDPLLVGKGAQAEVHLHARDASGRPVRAALRIGASVGKLSPLVETAPGEYRATYRAPDERYPQVAILAALSLADGAFSARPLRLAARVPVSGVGEPGASMRILVDGKPFGPVTVDESGQFTLPIVVPPGGRAVGVSTDALGNQRRHDIDLALPPFPRLVLAAVPRELPANGRAQAEVVAFAVDERGKPERNRAPIPEVDRGTLSAVEARSDGVWSWTYTAPLGVGEGVALVHAATSATRIALEPAPPFHLELEPPEEPLGAGSNQPTDVQVKVLDGSAAPVDGARLEASLVGGKVLGARPLGHGAYALSLVPPHDPGRGFAAFHVELGALLPGPPRRVTLHPARAAEHRLAAEAWVDDDLGLPVPGVEVAFTTPTGIERVITDRFGVARVELPRPASPQARIEAELVALPGLGAALDWLTVGDASFAVSSVGGGGALEAVIAPPLGASLDADLPLSPAAPVDLRLSTEPAAGDRVTVHVVARGQAKLAWQASGGELELTRPLDGGRAELRFTPPAGAPRGARFVIAVTDEKSRVTAFTEVVTK